MSVQLPTSMAKPTDSAKDPANPDTTLPTAAATARAPTTIPALKNDADPPSHCKVDARSTSDKTFASSPTLVCADTVDQQKEPVGPVEQSSAANSRRSSAGSLRFDIPNRPGLPRGDSRGINGRRIRNASPPPTK